MCVLVRAGLYPGLSVYCLLLTASPVLQSICSGVREILFCSSTSVLVEQSVCVHPLFVLYCIVYYYKSVFEDRASRAWWPQLPRASWPGALLLMLTDT